MKTKKYKERLHYGIGNEEPEREEWFEREMAEKERSGKGLLIYTDPITELRFFTYFDDFKVGNIDFDDPRRENRNIHLSVGYLLPHIESDFRTQLLKRIRNTPHD